MKEKQSLLNIVIGSLLIALAAAFVHSKAHDIGTFEFAAGLFVVAFVVLLFLTSFLPSRAAKKAAGTKSKWSNPGNGSLSEQQGRPQRKQPYSGKYGRTRPRSRVNFRESRHRRRGQRENVTKVAAESAASGNDNPSVQSPATPPDNIGNSNVLRGTIKWYNKRKGFGFLLFENEEVFFHRNEIASPASMLRDDAKVEFVMGSSSKGPQAVDVRIIE